MKRLRLLACVLIAAGCAESVEDIDRTQGNLLAKADLEGEWYYLQTIVSVPPTSVVTLAGETSVTERLRWEIQRDVLIGYRSYELVPGAADPSRDTDFDGTEAPVAAFAIIEHVDVVRDYDPASGEQSNVVREDVSDRLWHERDYIRVDWSHNLVTNFDFIAPASEVTALSWFREAEQAGPDPFYSESTDDGLVYFDVLGRLVVDPQTYDWDGEYEAEPACWYYLWGAIEDCAPAEVEVRYSFSRVPASKRYEPFHYDDQLLSRFGFFRTEFSTHDPQRGITDAGQRYLVNRFDIWQQSYDGEVPIPLSEREVRTRAYYLNADFPDDELLRDAARETIAQWNGAARRAVSALKGKVDLPDVFVLCDNPVSADDHDACGARGFSPRPGDLRYSTLHWVDPFQIQGPLGYGPAAIDPVTGEILSGRAYVYAAGINSWATDAVDVVRYFNEALDLTALTTGEDFTDRVIADLGGRGRQPRPSARLDRAPLDRSMRRAGAPNRKHVRRETLRSFDRGAVRQKLARAREAGGGALRMNDEVRRALESKVRTRWNDVPSALRERLDPTRIYGPEARWKTQEMRHRARTHNVALKDAVAPDLAGLVATYVGRTDYEQMWRELRAEVFASTAEHEIGHTLGLRHNFQGSYDSINYPDAYWALRAENIGEAGDTRSVGDIYRLANLTQAQSEGQMRQRQYSSIMDYNYRWQSDLSGIGKYDEAAIVFGYSAGARRASGQRCDDYPSVPDGDGCLAQLPGLVEVFSKPKGALGTAGELLDGRELGYTFDDPGLPSITLLERRHYVNVALSFPTLDDLRDRELMGYADYLAQKDAPDRRVRVPYLFCSDEWEGGLISCHAYDQGAEPFELTLTRVRDYRAYYPFVNFRRDRAFFSIDEPYSRYYWNNFLPLSDYYQSWYVAPWGYDDLFDRGYELAIHTAFNALAEVLTTPSYGVYCEDDSGGVQWLSEEPTLRDRGANPLCRADGRTVEFAPGVGRREFSRYEPAEGYYFEYKPAEAGHYWTTWAAVEALFDPDAYVVGVEGDAGIYAISFYDIFERELEDLVGGLLTKDYSAFAPTAVPTDEEGPSAIRSRPAAPVFDADFVAYDPETGEEVSRDAYNRELCQPCDFDVECVGYTGQLGGRYCQPIQDGSFACLADCTEDAALCPGGTECDDLGNCVPTDGVCATLVPGCDDDHPFGVCEVGEACVEGACRWRPRVEAEPTFMLWTDLLWYGMLYTTADYSTLFNHRIHVLAPGSASPAEYDERVSERHAFTNPLTGVTYSAYQARCILGGPVGRCGGCQADADCQGYTGALGGVYCQPPDPDDGALHCLQDCTNDASLCPPDTTCDAAGNCVPEGLECEAPLACGPDAPDGSCPAGTTCLGGDCLAATCRSEGHRDNGSVRLVRRGQALATAYATALERWYESGLSPEEDRRRGVIVGNARYQLNSHVALLETLVSTYGFFGQVY